TSCGPASAMSLVASAGVTTSAEPSAIRSARPLRRIASRCAPRAIRVTCSPASASLTPRKPPVAPAPTIQIRIASSNETGFGRGGVRGRAAPRPRTPSQLPSSWEPTLQLAQIDPLQRVIMALLQDEPRPLARGGDIGPQVGAVNGIPDPLG